MYSCFSTVYFWTVSFLKIKRVNVTNISGVFMFLEALLISKHFLSLEHN